MATKRNSSAVFKRTVTAVSDISREDEQSTVQAKEDREQRAFLRLTAIQPRDADTRPLKEQHVIALKESIATLGLIEPLVIDKSNVLLAGGHRLAALQRLNAENAALFQQHFANDMVPVRMMPFHIKEAPQQAFQVEIAENEHRRDYTPAEARAIADRLREAGYRDIKGRPRQDQKPLMPALALVMGKNLRTVQRYLTSRTDTGENQESTTDVVLLGHVAKSLKKWQRQADQKSRSQELFKKLPEILALIDDAMADKR